MRKYDFRVGDIVRERTTAKKPIIGKVIGCGSSAEHDFYKVASRGEVYSAREDELTLVRRAPGKHSKSGLIDQFLLDWYPMSEEPAEDEECLVIWRDTDGARRLDAVKYDGREFVMETEPGFKIYMGAECFDAWAPWEWPDAGADNETTGMRSEEDDGSGDQDG